MSTYIPPVNSANALHVWLGYTALGVNVSGASLSFSAGLVTVYGLTQAFVGGWVWILQAGPLHAPFWTTVASVTSATTCTLTATPAFSVTNVQAVFYLEANRIHPNNGAVLFPYASGAPSFFVQLNSIDFESSLTSRPTFDFTLRSFPGAGGSLPFQLVVGQPVLLTHDTLGFIFGGSIDSNQCTLVRPDGLGTANQVKCVSWDNTLTRRLLILSGGFPLGTNVDSFTGNGSQVSFNLTNYPATIQRVTLNKIPMTFGQAGSGAYLIYTLDVYQVTTATAPPAGQQLVVSYNVPGSQIPQPSFYLLSAGAIVKELTDLLVLDGLSLDSGAVTGPMIESIQFSAQDTFDSALTSLMSYIQDGVNNYWYYVDPHRVLHFEIQGVTTTAPFVLSDYSLNYLWDVSLTVSRDKLANAAWSDITNAVGGSPAANGFQGDGSTTSFNATYGIESIQNLYYFPPPGSGGADYYASTFGVTGTTGKDWYYTQGSNVLTQDTSFSPMPVNAELNMFYTPALEVTEQAFNGPSIGSRQSIESGTGEWDLYLSLSNNTPVLSVANVAQNQSSAYAAPSQVLTFTTYQGGLVTGQALSVGIASLGALGTFVVDQVKLTDEDGVAKWVVTANLGAVAGDWKLAFRRLANLL